MGCSSSSSSSTISKPQRLLPVYQPFPYSPNRPGTSSLPPIIRSSVPPRTSENKQRPTSFQLRQQQYQLQNQPVNNQPLLQASAQRVSSSKHGKHARPSSTPSKTKRISKHGQKLSRPSSTPLPQQMMISPPLPMPPPPPVPSSPPASLVFPLSENVEDSPSSPSTSQQQQKRKYFIQDPVQPLDVDLQHPKMIEVSVEQWNHWQAWQASQSPRTSGSSMSAIDDIPPPTQHTQLSPGLLYTINEDTIQEIDKSPAVPKSRKSLISAKKPLRVPNPLGVPEKTIDAIPWLQEQLEKRRYRGLRTASDVSEFVAKHVGVTDDTAIISSSIFRDNNIRPKLFVALTEEDLLALGVTTTSDRQKIVLAGADLVTAGHADLEGFLMSLLAYQFQLMLAMLFEVVREQTSPKTLINKQFTKFVESLDWYQQSYAGGKKELTPFQKEMLYIDLFSVKILEEEKGKKSVDIGAVTRDLVAKGLARPDDLRFYKLLGLNEAKLMETLEVRNDQNHDDIIPWKFYSSVTLLIHKCFFMNFR